MSTIQPHVTHRTPKYRPFTRLTASTIALAVLLSPLELPISSLVSNQEDFFIDPAHTAKESYESNQEVATNLGGDETIVFTRGAGAPKLGQAETTPDSMVAPSLALLTTAEETVTDNAPALARLVKHTKRGENVIAALAVAEGDTLSELSSVELDVEGNITQTTDVHGATKAAEYDEAGRPVRITNADGSESFYDYNAKGQLTGVSHTPPQVARGPIMSVLAVLANPLFALADNEESASFFYEADNIAAVQDSAGATAYEYDEDGLLSSETYSDGSGVEYSYDDLGNLVSSEEFDSRETKLSFGSFLRMSYASIASTYFAEESSYNDNNQLAQYRISEVVEAPTPAPAPAPEAMIVAEEVASSSTAPVVAEVVASSTPASAVMETIEATSTVESTTPLLPSVIEEAVIEATEAVVAYFSSAAAQLAVWFGASVSRAWAEVTTVAEGLTEPTAVSTSTALYAIEYSYDAQGNVSESRTTGGVVTKYSYDVKTDALIAKEVTTAQGVVDRQDYQVDAQARITAGDGTSYEFTDSGMLATAGAAQYQYDEFGNRTVKSGLDAATYTYSGNRLLGVSYESGRTISYTYDERGAVSTASDSKEGVTEFAYTTAGAVESISRNGIVISYTYDALGRRVSRTSSVNGVWMYEYNGTLLKRVVAQDEVVLREYFYTPAGELTAVRADGALYQVVTSGNKSVTGLVEISTGSFTKQSYDAWGAVESSNFPVSLDIGYIGAFTEAGLGVSVFGPRVYDPELGRFLSKDPLPGVLVDGLSQNEYIYAKNDPIHQFDPSGHASEIAQKSDSPKRALVETETALELLRKDENQARETYDELVNLPIIQIVDVAAHEQALARAQAGLEAAKGAVDSLEILYSLQVQAIEENRIEATLPSAVESEVVSIVDVTQLASTTVSEIEVPSSIVNAEPVSSSTIESITFSLPALEAVTETEPIASTTEVSTTMFGSVLAMASAVFGDHLLKAEAKKKKSKSKNKKAKKKSSKKAKEKQAKKAKQLAKMKKQLDGMQKQLLAMKAVVDKRVESERQAKQLASNALRNIEATNAAQVAKLNLAPAKPASTLNTGICGITMSCAPTSAGITAPLLSYHPTPSPTVSQYFTTQNAHYALGACGLNPSVDPFSLVTSLTCDLADGVLYALEGDWTGAGLSVTAGLAPSVFGAAAGTMKIVKLGSISVTASRMSHVINNHTVSGSNNLGKSVFGESVNIEKLIISSSGAPRSLQSGGNYERIISHTEVIGIDRSKNELTNVYTVITDAQDNLITAFPGRP